MHSKSCCCVCVSASAPVWWVLPVRCMQQQCSLAVWFIHNTCILTEHQVWLHSMNASEVHAKVNLMLLASFEQLCSECGCGIALHSTGTLCHLESLRCVDPPARRQPAKLAWMRLRTLSYLCVRRAVCCLLCCYSRILAAGLYWGLAAVCVCVFLNRQTWCRGGKGLFCWWVCDACALKSMQCRIGVRSVALVGFT
jgi:hypothetical protein